MTLSIVMPVFNRERYVGPAIRSLLRQRNTVELDIIVVDDGSTDASREIVRALNAQSGCIRLISQDNLGVTRARNVALRNLLPDTEFVSFLDSDDISPADRFAIDMPRLRDSSVDFVYGRMCRVDRIDDEKMLPASGAKMETLRGIQLAAGIFRRDYLQRIGEFDERFGQGEDSDFLFRIFEQRRKAAFPDTVGVYYRRHDDNMTNQTIEMKKGFLRALACSAQRRRRNPSLADLAPIFGRTPASTVENA